jgi:sec-independent protein translocase protein TatB
MLPEAGATELIFLAAIALIVVGPKDLPVLMRKVGQWVAKMRGLAAEFRSSFDELARQSELDELRKEVEALRNTRLADPLAELSPSFDEVNALGNPPFDPNDYSSDLPYVVDPHPPITTIEEVPAAKPARAPRKPKAAAVVAEAKAEPVMKAKPQAAKPKAPAKPRTAKARTAAESEG